jgi:hypothetical protein
VRNLDISYDLFDFGEKMSQKLFLHHKAESRYSQDNEVLFSAFFPKKIELSQKRLNIEIGHTT